MLCSRSRRCRRGSPSQPSESTTPRTRPSSPPGFSAPEPAYCASRLSAVIARYSRPAMARIWSDESKFARWLDVELAALQGWADAGVVPAEAVAEIGAAAVPPSPQRVAEIERQTHHDVAAFVDAVAEELGPAGRWFHYGLTSSDVVDTALALQIRDAGALILAGLERAFAAVATRAEEHRETIQIGRTHGVHAEPLTFGLKLAGWAFELDRDRARLERALEGMRVGKLSGAVGTYSATDPEVEQVQEPFGRGQKGSSAMPHKRNPVVAERICGLARIVRAAATVSLENVALWHERDISHSSAERVVIPDAFLALDYMLDRFAWLIEGLVVRPERMRRNVESSHGLYFSQRLLLALVESGLLRDEAYRLVQRHALRAWDEEQDFRELVRADRDLAGRVDLDTA